MTAVAGAWGYFRRAKGYLFRPSSPAKAPARASVRCPKGYKGYCYETRETPIREAMQRRIGAGVCGALTRVSYV